MLEGPEVEGHVRHTGHRRLDTVLGLAAIVMSATSVGVALHHGRIMEKLVEANTWPVLTFDSSNTDDTGKARLLRFSVQNGGIGPTRIETFQVFVKGKPVHDSRELLKTCCGLEHVSRLTSTVRGTVLPARETLGFLKVDAEVVGKEVFEKLESQRYTVDVRACYCSVFDECWTLDSRERHPRRGECTAADADQYVE